MSILYAQVFSILISLIAFLFAGWLFLWVKRQPSDNPILERVGSLIRQGARTFLKKEYKILAFFAFACAILILLFLPSPIWKGEYSKNIIMAIAYLAGTFVSAIAGKIGIEVATIANVKAAEAAQKGIKPAFLAGFRGRGSNGNGSCRSQLIRSYFIVLAYQ